MKIIILTYLCVFCGTSWSQGLFEKIFPDDVNLFSFSHSPPGPSIRKLYWCIQKTGDKIYFCPLALEPGAEEVTVETVEEKFLKVLNGGRPQFWLRINPKSDNDFQLYPGRELPANSATWISCQRIKDLDMFTFHKEQLGRKSSVWVTKPLSLSYFTFTPLEEKGKLNVQCETQGGHVSFDVIPEKIASKGFPIYDFSLGDRETPLRLEFTGWNSFRMKVGDQIIEAISRSSPRPAMARFSSESHTWDEMLFPRGEGYLARRKEMETMQIQIGRRLKSTESGWAKAWVAPSSVASTKEYFENVLKIDPPAGYENWQLLSVEEEELEKGWRGPVWISNEWPIQAGEHYKNSIQKITEPAVIYVPQGGFTKIILPGAVLENVPELKALENRKFKVISATQSKESP